MNKLIVTSQLALLKSSKRWLVLVLGITLFATKAVATPQTFISPSHQVGLLELYSSQGCSSCPPAERWISRFIDEPKLWQEIIPINFRVNYWDYLGWKDPYSSAKFSERQRLYRALGYSRTVATPGFIVNGEGWNGWFYQRPLELVNNNYAGQITATVDDQIKVSYQHKDQDGKLVTVNTAILGFGLEDYVSKGENEGHTFVQDFVVLDHQQQNLKVTASDKGKEDVLSFPKVDVSHYQPKRTALVVWISEVNRPNPLQAVGGWLE